MSSIGHLSKEEKREIFTKWFHRYESYLRKALFESDEIDNHLEYLGNLEDDDFDCFREYENIPELELAVLVEEFKKSGHYSGSNS